MLQQCTVHISQLLRDILVRTTDLEITDRVQGQKQFVIDVKAVAMVDGNGWLSYGFGHV